jgi:hypothetical protein
VTDAAVLQVADFCEFLQSLNLRGCKSITGMGFTFLKQATSLTRLKVGGCDQISERAFADTIVGLSNLTKLDASDLDGLSDSSVEIMLSSCPKLKSVNVNNNMMLTSKTLDCFARYGQGIASLSIGGNANFDDEAMKNMLVHAESLIKLKMSGCVSLTDATLQSITHYGAALEYLDICQTATTANGLLVLKHELRGVELICDNLGYTAQEEMDDHLLRQNHTSQFRCA